MSMTLDFGLVHSAQKRADGSIDFYGRFAVANRPMTYLNANGSTHQKVIGRDELFKPSSIATMKIQTITHPHSTEDLTPDNYKKFAVGSTGNLAIAGLDGDFAGIVGSLKSRDAIAAYDAGIRELSPGYTCKLVKIKDGLFEQLDRDYFELALVDRARGGADVRMKDSADIIRERFDPSQIDAQLLEYWARDSAGFDANAINRLLISGTLSPPPITLPEKIPSTNNDSKMNIKLTIGTTPLEIDPACLDAATNLKSEYEKLQASAALRDTAISEAATAQTQLDLIKAENLQLQQQVEASKSSIKDGLGVAIKEIHQASADLQLFGQVGFDTAAAKTCLDNADLDGFKAAIVKLKYPDKNYDADLVRVCYDGIKAGLTSSPAVRDMMGNMGMGGYGSAPQAYGQVNYQMPTQIQQLTGNGGGIGGAMGIIAAESYGSSGENSLINGQGTFTNGLPPDTEQNGWR